MRWKRPWLRWIFNIPSAEEVMAQNELMHEKKRMHEEKLRKRAAEIRADREKKAARMAERAQAEAKPSEGTRKRILLFEDDEKQSRHNRSRTKTQEHQLKLLNPAINGMKK